MLIRSSQPVLMNISHNALHRFTLGAAASFSTKNAASVFCGISAGGKGIESKFVSQRIHVFLDEARRVRAWRIRVATATGPLFRRLSHRDYNGPCPDTQAARQLELIDASDSVCRKARAAPRYESSQEGQP
jgi:hypothetical protein